MTFAVKEVYYTLQGEGGNAGRPAVFLRFAGCNLWSGTSQDRDRGRPLCAQWCDTDFVGTDGPGGGRYDIDQLVRKVFGTWPTAARQVPADRGGMLVVCTGGEPMLQLTPELVYALQNRGFSVAIETNGTIAVPECVDYVCVSPKGAPLQQRHGNELKLVYPQPHGISPADLEDRFSLQFDRWYISPMWVPNPMLWDQHTAAAVQYVKEHPRWRLSLQTHKGLGIP